jgi:diguanylate cyclase (GGDEF)-like protein
MAANDTPQVPTARDRIARLRASFVEQLPQRLDDMQALWASLQDAGDSAETIDALHRGLHNLKGTASSFGFADLARAAEQAEACVIAAVEAGAQALSVQCVARVEGGLAALSTQANLLLKALPSDTWEGSPSFALPSGAPRTDAKASGRLVYVCDDDPLILEKITSQVSCFGYQCQGFISTAALRVAVLARSPDVLVMDIHFPEGAHEGTQALAALHQELGLRVPTVFLSGRSDFDARIKAVQAGGQAFLHKPADALTLVSALDTLTGQQQPGAYRILIVDDEPQVASYHSVLLQEAGMLTYELGDPTRILAVLDEFRPDLVLMDIYLPQCNGRDLATLIRQLPDYMSIPIIYLSSELDHKKQFSAMRVGAEGFLTKPVDPNQLIESVGVRAERMRVLRGMMARDSLTGLLNHSETTRTLQSAVAAAQRTGGEMCFAMIDIDHFKHVNDSYGHPTGDQVLLALSRLLQQRLRTSDTVGRYGGEEFALILPDVDLVRACELVDALREAFSHIQFHSGQTDFGCTFSAGVASVTRHGSLASLREAADKALYGAKKAGRNQVMADGPINASGAPA